MPYGPSTRTVMDVQRAVQRMFGDESGVQLETNDILMWVNNAQEEIVRRNKIIKATATATTVVDQASYTFPTDDILQMESLHFDGQKLQNVPFAQADQDLITKETSAETGTPEVWWEWGGTFTLFPAPHEAKTIKLFYTKMPERVTTTSDLLTVPDKYYKQVVDFVLQQGYEMDEEPELSEMKARQFDNGLLEMAEEERSAQQLTYSTITVVD